MRPHHLFDIRGLLAVAILLVAMPAHAQFCFDANGPLVPGAGERANAVAIGDLDGDGLADVVTANDATDRVAVLRQLAGGTLDTAVLWATGENSIDGAPPTPATVGLSGVSRSGCADSSAASSRTSRSYSASATIGASCS